MHSFLAVAALAASVGSAFGQSVEFRIVERTGRTAVTGLADAELNLAVQARVLGTTLPYALGAFSFDVHIVGEPESNGTLARGLISNPDHTYTTVIGTSASIGRGGVASQFSYLAGVNPSFNGVINLSSGTFINGPDQEIGLITGSAFAQSLLNTPGLDADSDNNPDTWTGNGSGATPASGTTAPLDPAIGPVYFGSGATWIDVYRFRYTVTNFPARTLVFRLESKAAAIRPDLKFSNGVWGMPGINGATAISSSNLLVSVATSGLGSCCDGSTGTCTTALAIGCAGIFLPVASCTPNPCPQAGRCCGLAGSCAFTLQSLCVNSWDATGTCVPNLCPATSACCSAIGGCTVVLQSECNGAWVQSSSCSPNLCARVGSCCNVQGACLLLAQPWCTNGTWALGTPCLPNPCSLGACCTILTGCAQTIQGGCIGGIWTTATACVPTPCVVGGCCDVNSGNCTIEAPSACLAGSVFLGIGAACDVDGLCWYKACCNTTTHACSMWYSFETCPSGAVSQGTNSSCYPNICPGFVCCSPTTGVCSVIGPSGVCPADRINLGPGTACNVTLCPRIACCNTLTGACSTVGAQGTCPAGAISLGTNATCSTVSCPVVACCSALTGACSLIGPSGTCPTGAVLQGGSICYASPCATVACCNNTSGVCTITGPLGMCPADTTSRGPASSCTPNACPPPGRCCVPTGVCTYITHAVCIGTWSGGYSCGYVCPQPGRCCVLGGACSVVLASACSGYWDSQGSCPSVLCSQYGACCHEGFCSIRPQGNCPPNGTFQYFRGPGIACGTAANPIGCCLANFNMVNGVDIQDLNDFLAAWFAHDPSSDFDRDGAMTFTDVTRFISAWTAGCH